ncbi:MAG: 8-oxo-dGTP diphosphatase [Candidatus Shapirobacteria bacterium]|nr:8-oxo-dGTP diphosphatase [Candidatus Shapirobacteria bacterium]
MNLRQTTLGFLIKDNQILLAMKKRGFGAGKWNGVGGKPNDGELIEETLKREIMEEIGVVFKNQELVAKIKFYFKNNQDWNQEVVVYKINEWENEPQESEEMAPMWYDIDKIPYDKMWVDDRFWLPKVLSGEKIEAIFVFGENEEILEMEIKNRND